MTEDGNLREELLRLTQVLAGEGAKLMGAFAARQGLHPTDVAALTRILVGQEQGAPLTPGVLAEELALTSGAVTSVLDRLERAGHVVRVRDGNDRRKVLLHYSPGGRELADAFLVPFRERAAVVTDQFSSAELDAVRRYLAATAADMAAFREVLQDRATSSPSSGARPGRASSR
jgi:DNA-binding MarR family transcriptional regulator